MTETRSKPEEQIRKEWTLGSYPNLAQVFLPLAAELVDAADVGPGDRVLDVACGTGNVALTAHRRGADVTGVDITPAMLETARERAAVIDAGVDWQEGDGADLPLADDTFDVTLSCLGHMFVDDPEAAADELVRVTEPGGRIAYTSWTPESGIAAMIAVLSEYLPTDPNPPPSPVLWGDPDSVSDRFDEQIEGLHFETGTVRYPALSPAHFWKSMTTDSGSVILALEAVETARTELHAEEVETLAEYFSEGDNAVKLEYRLVTAIVR